MQAQFAINKPALISLDRKKLLRKSLRGNERDYARERERNKYLGKRGFQIKMFAWSGEQIARFCCSEESDIIELFIQIHTPGAFPYREYNIDPNTVGDVQIFITQSLTTGPGTTQNFITPATWSNKNTISCIAGGGGGGGSFDGTNNSGGAGGGGGACSQISNLVAQPGDSLAYQIGEGTTGVTTTKNTYFNGTSISAASVSADRGRDGLFGSLFGGVGGLASNGIGAIKFNGGNGGAAVNGPGSTFSGGGAGAAGSPTGGGGVGNPGTSGTTSGKGGDSSTAIGGAATTGAANAGGAGTDFDASHGAGAGSSGRGAAVATGSGIIGALYGAGASGACYNGSQITTNINGQQGMIFISWSPFLYTEVYNTN